MTSLLEQWMDSLPDSQELGTQATVSSRILKVIETGMADNILGKMSQAVVKGAIINGQWPVSVELEENQDRALRAVDICMIVETRKQPFLAGYITVLEQELVTAYQQMQLPWWKLLWRKWGGRLETKMPWERHVG